jgi:hypothetical protein
MLFRVNFQNDAITSVIFWKKLKVKFLEMHAVICVCRARRYKMNVIDKNKKEFMEAFQ